MAEKVWSRSRKVMGNLLPAVLCLPLLGLGLFTFKPDRPLDSPAIWFFIAFPVVGWVSLNFLGFYQNSFMKRELMRRLGLFGTKAGPKSLFVGVARPRFRSSLDPHEDVGFLLIKPDRLEFLGETVQVNFEKKDIRRIRTRANPHTWVFLGRWISIEGEAAGTPVRLLIEPREKATLLGNLLYSERLKDELIAWAKSKP